MARQRSARSSRPPPSFSHAPAAPSHRTLGGLLLAIAILGQVGLYYALPPGEIVARRIAALVFLVAPEELVRMWCGGQFATFHIRDRIPLAAGCGAILLGAWAAGQLVLAGLELRPWLDRWQRPVVAMAVGLNLLSLTALAIGLVGRLHQRWLFVTVWGLLVGGETVRRWWSWASRASLPSPATVPSQVTGKVKGVPTPSTLSSFQDAPRGGLARSRDLACDDPRWAWLLVGLVPWGAVVLLGSMLPPWEYDVREYHLQAPKEWFQAGRIDFMPHNIYANMPLGSELLSLWGMALVPPQAPGWQYLTAPPRRDAWWWGAMIGKTVMGCYALLATAAVIAFGRRVHSLAAGVLAGLLFLSTPWIGMLAIAGYNEGPVALYAILTWMLLLQADEELPAAVQSRLHLVAGFCAGSAVACKYPPALFLVVPAAAWLLIQPAVGAASPGPLASGAPLPISRFLPWTSGWTRTRALALFLAGVLAGCGLWLGKNWVLSGNPTYPLLYRVFDGRTRTDEKDRQWRRVHSPQPDERGRRYTIRSLVQVGLWNGWQTAWASLTIPPLLIFAWRTQRARGTAAVLAGWMLFVFLSWWLATHRLDRFLVLLVPAAALLAAVGALESAGTRWRWLAVGWVLSGGLVQFVYVTIHPDNRYFAPLEALRRDDRGLGEIGVRVAAAHRWLNENARPDERVLLLGDAEPFDLEIEAVYNTCFDDCQFTRIFKDRTRQERLVALQQERIAYVYCSWFHLERYRREGNYGYTSDYPTRERVHRELVVEQKLLIPIAIETDPQRAELFRVAAE